MQANSTLAYSRKTRLQQEALMRAISGQSLSNYPAIIDGFLAKGISEGQIKPRENVFTSKPGKPLAGTSGARRHGVKVATVRDIRKAVVEAQTGEKKDEQ